MKPIFLLAVMAACSHEQQRMIASPVDVKVVLAADTEVRALTVQFVTAAEKRDFAAVFAMLSGALRARYTPERLAHDFDVEPLAHERLARLRQASNQPFVMTPTRAELPLGGEKVFTLVHDADGWRVSALE